VIRKDFVRVVLGGSTNPEVEDLISLGGGRWGMNAGAAKTAPASSGILMQLP
jgi:hypothetical protein